MDVEVTIFTPTYNRGYSLDKLYKSLKKQDCKNFEWLVVDDGSEDNTKELLKQWTEKENDFPIRYYYQNNGGKHRAINYGVEKAKGRLFFIVDSDDFIIDDAVKTILKEEMATKVSDYKLAGFGFNKGKAPNMLVGNTFLGESVILSSLERGKYNIIGDKAEVFYTQILKKYKFPEFLNENFVTESVVWYKIANDGYKIKWINKIIYICEYLDDGLTKNSIDLAINNFEGYTYTICQFLKYNLSKKEKLILIGVYTRIARLKNMKFSEISENIDQNVVICFIMGSASKVSSTIKKSIK